MRPTLDVDCVVDVTTASDYYAVVARLRGLGFKDCSDEGAPLCRLVYAGIRVDVVAVAETAVGPSNRWYPEAVSQAVRYQVADDLSVLAITPIYFLATKFEAFRGRGGGDFRTSHDLEDILSVLGGMRELRDDVATESTSVALAIRAELVALAPARKFIDAIPGHFHGDEEGQRRAALMIDWVERLSAS